MERQYGLTFHFEINNNIKSASLTRLRRHVVHEEYFDALFIFRLVDFLYCETQIVG